MKLLDGKSTRSNFSVEEGYRLEVAIQYMIEAFQASAPHSKPVMVHSLRVALALEADEHSLETVIAALFHDLLEDTEVSELQLREDYGDRITEIVLANSYGGIFKDRRERDTEMYERCVSLGAQACLVKCTDLYDNSIYFMPVETERRNWFLEKMILLKEMTEHLIGTELAWKRLRERALLLNG